jgi:hypothetical protein
MGDLDRTLHAFRYEDPRRRADSERRPDQRFDRLAFALEAVGMLRLHEMRVAVFPSNRLVVEEGRDLARGPLARWAMVGIPKDASAESIVLALGGLARASGAPYALQATLRAAELAATAN